MIPQVGNALRVEAESDVTAPVVHSISLDKSGQTVRPGDVLTLDLSIVEESGLSAIQVVFEHAVSGATVSMEAANIPHSADGNYQLQYTIGTNLDSGRWILAGCSVIDEFANVAAEPYSDSNIYFDLDANLYTITFDSHGGSSVESTAAYLNMTIQAPTPPVREGYTFAGWYKDEAGTQTWDFATEKVTADITLHAQWLFQKILYQSHVQYIGWQDWVSNGASSGTSGQSLRLEAIQIKLENVAGGIEYCTHVQDYGWMNWVADGALSGTSGESKRLEAIKIRLTGAAADPFDVYYRVHAQNFGWLDWAKNGDPSGTAGYGYRLEAIQIVLVPKGGTAPGATARAFVDYNFVPRVLYQTHVQDYGWQAWVNNGATAGTSGESKRLEAINIKLQNLVGNIEYRTHVQDYGWMGWKANGMLSGTSGESKRLEAIEIRLSGEVAENYDVYYRVHAQNFGWLDWAMNGQSAGTAGFGYRLEAIQIVLVPKGEAAPGATARAFVQG